MKHFDSELKEINYDVTNFGKIPEFKIKFLTKEESEKLPKPDPNQTFYSGIDKDGNFVSW